MVFLFLYIWAIHLFTHVEKSIGGELSVLFRLWLHMSEIFTIRDAALNKEAAVKRNEVGTDYFRAAGSCHEMTWGVASLWHSEVSSR